MAVATAAGFRVQWLAQGPPASASVSSARGGAVTLPSRWLLVAPQSRDAVSSAAAHCLPSIAFTPCPFERSRIDSHARRHSCHHAAQSSDPATGALVAPIYQTSTFEQQRPGVGKGFDYARTNNPTRQRLETVLAELEGVTHCAVFASGLAAEHALLQAFLRPGDQVIVPVDVYGGTYRLLHRVFAGFNLTITPVDTTDLEAVAPR